MYVKCNPAALVWIYLFYKNLNSALKVPKLIAISPYIQKLLRKHSLKSIVIPNFLDLKDFYSKNTQTKKPKILYLGSMTKFKGPQLILQAVEGIKCRCDFYGEGIIKDELIEYINKHNIDAEVHNRLSYEKIPKVYAESDIVVFPSIWPEPFGRIAIEAMASGKIVIGSDIGGIHDTLSNTGILFTPGSKSDLRQAILKVIKNPKDITKIKLKYSTEIKKYSEEAVISRLIKFYSEN
jgi:glycosyltransferase involved in cell wall biosynthesis